MINFKILFVLFIFITGCSKMEEKKPTGDTKTPNQKTQNPPKQDNNSQMQNNASGQTDEKATVLVKEADESINKSASDKSEESKKEAIAKCMEAANYLTFEATLPAKEKYRPALKYYRKVLELDPNNAEAIKNKKQIEDIYEQMGMPIPQ